MVFWVNISFSRHLMPRQSYYRRWWMTVNQDFFVKYKIYSPGISVLLIPSHTKIKVWYWNILILFTIRIYCYRKQAWLSVFLLYKFKGKLAITHVIFKNIGCMVLRYHILHYFWYKQPLIFKLSNCSIDDKKIRK